MKATVATPRKRRQGHPPRVPLSSEERGDPNGFWRRFQGPCRRNSPSYADAQRLRYRRFALIARRASADASAVHDMTRFPATSRLGQALPGICFLIEMTARAARASRARTSHRRSLTSVLLFLSKAHFHPHLALARRTIPRLPHANRAPQDTNLRLNRVCRRPGSSDDSVGVIGSYMGQGCTDRDLYFGILANGGR